MHIHIYSVMPLTHHNTKSGEHLSQNNAKEILSNKQLKETQTCKQAIEQTKVYYYWWIF